MEETLHHKLAKSNKYGTAVSSASQNVARATWRTTQRESGSPLTGAGASISGLPRANSAGGNSTLRRSKEITVGRKSVAAVVDGKDELAQYGAADRETGTLDKWEKRLGALRAAKMEPPTNVGKQLGLVPPRFTQKLEKGGSSEVLQWA